MTYVGYDGLGYQTGLASSSDLIQWQREGMIFGRGPVGSPTEYNAALNCVMRDNELVGPGTLKRVNGRFIGVYHAYPRPGLEEGAAVIGICYSDDLYHWEAGPAILTPQDGADWESGGLYKPWLIEHEGIYFLFYNAKNHAEGGWIEQTGMATSHDLLHWERYAGNPVLPVGPEGAIDDIFASDPCVFLHRGLWWMYFYTLGSDGKARDSAAYSRDLFNWTKTNAVLIDVGAPGSIDDVYAHKPGIIAKEGTLYHFYCAVTRSKPGETGEIEYPEMRGIAAAYR
jgi:predicted GH43/DUF377 family glycosyl hydrolase